MSSTHHRPTLSPPQFKRLVFFGHGANDLYWFILPVLLPMMLSRYNLRYAGGGTVLSIYLLVVALLSFVVGRLSDRTNRWRLIGFGFLLASVGFSLASIDASLTVFLILLGVAAVGVSTFHPTMYGAIEETIDSDRGKFYGKFEAWGGGTIAVMLVVTGFLLRSISWTGVLRLVAVPGFIAGIVFLTARRAPLRAPSVGSERKPSEKLRTVPRGILAAFLVSNMLRFITIMGVIAFMPTFFVHRVGLGPDLAGYSTALFFGGGVIGARIGGVLGDRFPPLGVLLVPLALIGPLVFLFGLISSPVLLGVVLFTFGVASMICIPLQNLTLTKMGPDLGGGEIFGLLLGAMTVTQALSPATFGAIADAVGLAGTVRLFAGPAVLSWIVLFLVARTRSVRHLVSTRHAGKNEGSRSLGTV